jgi:hypothetical protein
MSVKRIFTLLFILISNLSISQTTDTTFSHELDFLIHLEENAQIEDFNYYGTKLINERAFNIDQLDSLHYIIGFINYKFKNHSSAEIHLKSVSDQSIYYYKSVFYAVSSSLELKNTSEAYNYLFQKDFSDTDELIIQLQKHELAGIALLKRDFALYDSISASFETKNKILLEEHKLQTTYCNDLKNLKRKSPLVAGALSAIIPGAGLCYSGNNGQGLAAFLRVASLAGLSLESYNRLGPKNAQFIAFASLFSLFYVGNIWGSALSVRIRYDEKSKEIEHNLSVGLQIPIDNFFQ